MKKRLIVTLLLGALFVSTSSVFVSCKDYDDDVKDLQEQINSLSGLLTQKENTINSSITSLQSALTTLETAYKNADDATLTAAKQALSDAVAELEKAIKANYDSQVAKNAELDAAIIVAQNAADQAIKQLENKADAAVVKQLQDDLAAAQTALQNAINGKADQATVDNLNTEISNLKAAQAEAKTALENAQKQLQDAINGKADQATVTALEAQVTNLKKALEDKDAELATAIDNLNKAMAGKADEAEVTALQTKVNELQKALEAKDVELANAINDAKTQISNVSASLSKVEEKLGTLSTDVAGAVKNIAELQIALNGQKKALEEAQAALEEAIAENATNIGNNATAIANNGKSIEENKKAIADNLQAIAALQTNLTQLDTDMKKLIADEIQKVNNVLSTKADQATVEELKSAHETYAAENDKAVAAVKQKAEKAQSDVDALSNTVSQELGNLNTLIAALSKALRSLVFQPYLYVDGIESIEYPYLIDTLITKDPNLVLQRQRNTAYTVFNEPGSKKTLQTSANVQSGMTALFDMRVNNPISQEYFGPTWPVTYHMNPSKSNPVWDDIQGWNRRNAEVVTRSTAGKRNAIKVDRYFADGTTEVFKVESNGNLTVGLKVTEPHNLANHAIPVEADGRPGKYTEERTSINPITYKNTGEWQYDDIIALQVKSKKNEGDAEEKMITSDYAMIYPVAVWPEAIVWTRYQSKLGYTEVNFDENCPWLTANAKKCHVWKTPQDALGVNDATVYPDIELYYNNRNGIKLSDYLGIHYIKDTKLLSNQVPGTMALNSELFKQYGLKYRFELVDYTTDGNITHDSRYCTLAADGTIIAQNVKETGAMYEDESATSVDREPLVRVVVSRDNRDILDGYILVHITRNIVDEELYIDNYPKQSFTWPLCDFGTVFKTDWAMFSQYVLTQKMDNMTKNDFDKQYGYEAQQALNIIDDSNGSVWGNIAVGDVLNGVPDLLPINVDVHKISQNNSTLRFDHVMIFNNKFENGKDVPGTQCSERDLPGMVQYFHDTEGTTNHRFNWIITDDELEEYLHDQSKDYTKEARTVTKWFRYSRATGQASKYAYVYVKMTVDLKRKTIETAPIKEKIDNYWFNYQGSDTGWDAVVWNPWFPQDNGNTQQFVQNIPSTFRYNVVNFTTNIKYIDGSNANSRNKYAKFYFTPYEFQIQAQDGTWYTITARSGNTNETWNSFVCRYLRWQNSTTHYNHILQPMNPDVTYHNLHWVANSANHTNKEYTTHKWASRLVKDADGVERWETDYDANKKIHQQCAIYTGKFVVGGTTYEDEYLTALGIGGGVYDNYKLYAVKTAKGNIHGGSYNSAANYTEIATLNQNITSGEMQLTFRAPVDDITKEILNAIGYFKEDGVMSDENFQVHWNVKKELNAMVGVVAQNGCLVALDTPELKDGENNINAGTFYTSWQRPINVIPEDENFYDAQSNGDYHYTVDFVKIFDWRGPEKGYMWNDAQWLWAYYNVKAIIIDTYPGRVKTNMHQSNTSTFVNLSDVTTQARLRTVWNVQDDMTTPATSMKDAHIGVTTQNNLFTNQNNWIKIKTYPSSTADWPLQEFDLADKNNDLLQEMGLNPVNELKKLQFLGGIYYENNGDNVTDFDVKIPVWIIYEWGRFKTDIQVHIHRSLGN